MPFLVGPTQAAPSSSRIGRASLSSFSGGAEQSKNEPKKMIVLECLFLTIAPCDAAEPWQLGSQDAATPMMQGIIDLHHDIFFFLLLILIGITMEMREMGRGSTSTRARACPIPSASAGSSRPPKKDKKEKNKEPDEPDYDLLLDVDLKEVARAMKKAHDEESRLELRLAPAKAKKAPTSGQWARAIHKLITMKIKGGDYLTFLDRDSLSTSPKAIFRELRLLYPQLTDVTSDVYKQVEKIVKSES